MPAMNGLDALPPLSDELFYDLAELIYSECGLRFEENNRFLLHKRLAARLPALGMPGLRDYFLYLKFDPARAGEFAALHSALTTNETYFMRENGQLKAFVAHAVARLSVSSYPGSRRLRIWSAGCSSGEEAYSLALLLTEAGIRPLDFEIIGSDISDKVLAKARSATYTVHSFRFLDPGFRDKYFSPAPGDQWTLREPWRGLVAFNAVNLYRDPRLALFGQFDAIFCRNVLIYFDSDSKLAVLRNLLPRLRDGGLLFLGHSESLLTLETPFKMSRIDGEFAYTR